MSVRKQERENEKVNEKTFSFAAKIEYSERTVSVQRIEEKKEVEKRPREVRMRSLYRLTEEREHNSGSKSSVTQVKARKRPLTSPLSLFSIFKMDWSTAHSALLIDTESLERTQGETGCAERRIPCITCCQCHCQRVKVKKREKQGLSLLSSSPVEYNTPGLQIWRSLELSGSQGSLVKAESTCARKLMASGWRDLCASCAPFFFSFSCFLCLFYFFLFTRQPQVQAIASPPAPLSLLSMTITPLQLLLSREWCRPSSCILSIVLELKCFLRYTRHYWATAALVLYLLTRTLTLPSCLSPASVNIHLALIVRVRKRVFHRHHHHHRPRPSHVIFVVTLSLINVLYALRDSPVLMFHGREIVYTLLLSLSSCLVHLLIVYSFTWRIQFTLKSMHNWKIFYARVI